MNRIKKNDTVQIVSGKDKGKRSTVIEVCSGTGKLIVDKIALMVKHVKARKQGEVSAIKRKEGYIHESNVMPVCSSCNKPCRINITVQEGGQKARVCNQCKEIMA